MRKFIEYGVKLILIVLVLLGYQAIAAYANYQFSSKYPIYWSYVSYYALVLSYILCGMILAYNERKSGKAGLTKFVLVVIAVFLIGFPWSLVGGTLVLQNYKMLMELVRVMAVTFGILLTGLKL